MNLLEHPLLRLIKMKELKMNGTVIKNKRFAICDALRITIHKFRNYLL